jgi:hypothetical protein
MRFRTAFGGLTAVLFATPAVAQFNNQWVSFTKDNSKISSGTISSNSIETDVDWADADGDGWIDVAVARKQPFTSTGKRTNIFLRNVNGVLTNQTTQYATDSDVGGDQGFNTATNDRDVIFVDVNGDGWLDMVTATTLSDGEPKHIGHPRVYRNKGGATWQGFRFENGRIPQLLHFSSGSPQNPRFCSVAGGDVTGNGVPDLFFGDYDSSGAGGAQQGFNEDLNDRLLINDGSGFYSDQSQLRMTSDMLLSAFGNSVDIQDMNGNGIMDVVKDTALNPPQDVRVIYNNPANEGFFNQQHKFHTGFAPYHVNTGDMNNDGRMDVVVSDDAKDRHRYNTGTDALGRAIWGSAKTYQFLSGGDDGFASNNLVVDLDEDGWADAIHCDVDVDIGGCNRRMHIYHNPGGSVGQQITLREERQTSSGGWLGVVGMVSNDLKGVHDVAVADFDNDGDKDMLVSRCTGSWMWRNLLDPAPPFVCQQDIGFQGPGSATLSICGQPLSPGNQATLELSTGVPLTFAWVVVGVTSNPIPIFGGLLVPSDVALVLNAFTGADGKYTQSVPGGSQSDNTVYMQGVYYDRFSATEHRDSRGAPLPPLGGAPHPRITPVTPATRLDRSSGPHHVRETDLRPVPGRSARRHRRPRLRAGPPVPHGRAAPRPDDRRAGPLRARQDGVQHRADRGPGSRPDLQRLELRPVPQQAGHRWLQHRVRHALRHHGEPLRSPRWVGPLGPRPGRLAAPEAGHREPSRGARDRPAGGNGEHLPHDASRVRCRAGPAHP